MPHPEDYRQIAVDIARYLAQRQREEGAFPGPDNYGAAFALWLWLSLGEQFAINVESALQRLKANPPDSHGEFNRYALLHCYNYLGQEQTDSLLRQIPCGNKHSANWMLLRAVCRAHSGPYFSPTRARLEAKFVMLRYARHGFIYDRPGVRSFAYHAFCGAMLVDLWRLLGDPWIGRAAVEAAAAMLPFILPNGDALYIGRGQQQIFGYGALLHLLEATASMTGRPEFAVAADKVFGFLSSFRRPDGSFPLVLGADEEPEPWDHKISRPGWYSYNRYADYLPFLGCMLLKAAEPYGGQEQLALRSSSLAKQSVPAQRVLAQRIFRIWQCNRYTAVLAQPGGAITNDLAFPYLCVDGTSLFPCYGREGKRISAQSFPLPYGKLASGKLYGFRDRLHYRLTDSGLIGASRIVHHLRSFDFSSDGFTCTDQITFRRACQFAEFAPANFLFRNLQALPDGSFETQRGLTSVRLTLSLPASIIPHAATTASGSLVALRHNCSKLNTRAGDKILVMLKVMLNRVGS